MKKLCVILAIIIILSFPLTAFAAYDPCKLSDTGDQVSQIQTWLRWNGYFNYRTTGRFSELTEEAVKKFQSQNALESTGIADAKTQELLFSPYAKPASRNKNFVSVYGPRPNYPSRYGKIENWKTVNTVFAVGTTATVYDLYSDAAFTVTRTGGKNNAQVTPVSQDNADSFIAMCGGASTWEKRPVILSVNGEMYAAAIFCSLNYAGSETYGTTNLYFSGSTSDLFGIKDVEMDTAILKAGGEID